MCSREWIALCFLWLFFFLSCFKQKSVLDFTELCCVAALYRFFFNCLGRHSEVIFDVYAHALAI